MHLYYIFKTSYFRKTSYFAYTKLHVLHTYAKHHVLNKKRRAFNEEAHTTKINPDIICCFAYLIGMGVLLKTIPVQNLLCIRQRNAIDV